MNVHVLTYVYMCVCIYMGFIYGCICLGIVFKARACMSIHMLIILQLMNTKKEKTYIQNTDIQYS